MQPVRLLPLFVDGLGNLRRLEHPYLDIFGI